MQNESVLSTPPVRKDVHDLTKSPALSDCKKEPVQKEGARPVDKDTVLPSCPPTRVDEDVAVSLVTAQVRIEDALPPKSQSHKFQCPWCHWGLHKVGEGMKKEPQKRFTCPVCNNFCIYGDQMISEDDTCFEKFIQEEDENDSEDEDNFVKQTSDSMLKLDAVEVSDVPT